MNLRVFLALVSAGIALGLFFAGRIGWSYVFGFLSLVIAVTELEQNPI
jgi:hypothetical protein